MCISLYEPLLLLMQLLSHTEMHLFENPLSYSRIEKEDPEDVRHLKARFLIYKILKEADERSRRRPPCASKLRACRLRRSKIGIKLKRLRVAVLRQVMEQIRHLKLLLVTKC
ncbi:hypothetical protein ZIOFF_064779 [Zingiber officinale]|uniref:Uncharacterized protein n=1 Tax=Zingiber officinale TaxID=94328 RepID=A0A8J5EXL5_ZINOF|nr:hypothetical protein ZIOFF_064779 [Zingiber officinale]